ncbi:MAG: Sir2 family NAD-dependent protein deacetylase [Candidatus Competibacterales bacterium]
MALDQPLLSALITRLRGAQRLLFITGAGVSADSGLPTYRGVGGLYEDCLTDDDLPIETILSGEMFARRPELTWRYLKDIEAACRGATPNAAHRILATLAKEFEVWVFTQNVDGLHLAVAHGELTSYHVVEIHGNLHRLRCTQCVHRAAVADYQTLPPLPICPRCGAVVRPDVVLFGETLPEATMDRYYRELERGFDAVFSVGTTSLFPYISAPLIWAREVGITTVEINPGTTELSAWVDFKFPAGAAVTLTALGVALGLGDGG